MRNGLVSYMASFIGVCSSGLHTLNNCISAVFNGRGGGYFQELISGYMTQPLMAADDIRDCRHTTPKKGVVHLPFVYVNSIRTLIKKTNKTMKKQYCKPEFTVIRQNEANAKFFVASGDFTSTAATTAPSTEGQDAVSQYGEGNCLSM
ncbi:MAG: hypothetical protein MJZ93_05720 [Paludibacteraceae bacterium]|nr:hypothetical protein [Paludibacteraceae bacterium]